jgi:hypothetical protein
MNILNLKRGAFGIIAGALMLSGAASAATVGAGTFYLAGTAMGSAGGVDFYFLAPGDTTAIVTGPQSGFFGTGGGGALTAGTTQTIMPLTSANGVTPGSSFDFVDFVSLSNGVDLDVTSIPIPSLGVCPSSGSVAIGGSCLVNAASPVVLTQTATGVSASLDIYGEAHYAGQTTYTPYTGAFTAPSTNFATVAAFQQYFDANGGDIPGVGYSASFTTVASSAVPEPGTLAIVALGLIGCGFYRRKKSAVR